MTEIFDRVLRAVSLLGDVSDVREDDLELPLELFVDETRESFPGDVPVDTDTLDLYDPESLPKLRLRGRSFSFSKLFEDPLDDVELGRLR